LAVLSLPTPKISTFSKSKMAAAAILKNGHISAKAWPIDATFGTVTDFGRLELSTFLKSTLAASATLKHRKIETSKNGHVTATV